MSALKFHWSLPIDGEKPKASQETKSGVPDFPAILEFCKVAENCGIESLLTPFGFHMPDPIPLVSALASHTEKIKFLIAYRTGSISPTLFVQQINTLSHLLQGRLSLNMIAGTSPVEQAYYGDFSSHDERYARSEEFIKICRLLWRGSKDVTFNGKFFHIEKAQLRTPYYKNERPYIYMSGNSEVCKRVAAEQADCWLRYADTPGNIEKSLSVDGGRLAGGLRLSIIARSTRAEALRAADKIIANPDLKWKEFIRDIVSQSDSVAVKSTYEMAEAVPTAWMSRTLWTGAVPFRGGPAVSVVGSFSEVAQTFLEFKKAGCGEFILSGWPNIDEIKIFGENVLPEVRRLERM